MASEYAYPVIFAEDPAGGYVVSCQDLPELLTEGSTREEALAQALDALEEVFAARIRRGEDIPDPSEPPEDVDFEIVRVAPIMAAKAALAVALRQGRTSQTALARRLRIDEKEVRRLLDPRHASKLPRLQEALEALGRGLEVRVVDLSEEIRCAPPVSYQKLTSDAERLAHELFPEDVEQGRAIPVEKALQRLDEVSKHYRMPFTPEVVEDASLLKEGLTQALEHGLRMTFPPGVLLGASRGNGRDRFTVAHELAHAVLHHSELERQHGCAAREAGRTATEKLLPNLKIYEAPDWQANSWAGAFLMPFVAIQGYCERLAANGQELEVTEFARNFQVSVKAAEIRLQKTLPKLLTWMNEKGGDAN